MLAEYDKIQKEEAQLDVLTVSKELVAQDVPAIEVKEDDSSDGNDNDDDEDEEDDIIAARMN